MPIQKNQIHRLEITDLNSDGNGVGKIDGFVVFVPMTAVGDLIEAKIVKVLKQYAFGIVERILSLSPDRIDNDCPVYRQCGGCSLRHIRYEAELDIKRRQVEACFRRIGGIDLTVERILSNPHTEGYRNKAQFPVALRDGKAVAGFYAKRSHRVVPCGDCRLQSPAFAPLVRVILDFIDEYHLPPYDETNHTGLIRNLYLREAPATGEIMVCLVATKKHIPSADELARRLVACNPKVK
ncbi:MAG: TRAM domain-containing protein, partial [Massilioclostridium sp.]|nr:TRAM domain-containing protein [Massilioclostridium sp.]